MRRLSPVVLSALLLVGASVLVEPALAEEPKRPAGKHLAWKPAAPRPKASAPRPAAPKGKMVAQNKPQKAVARGKKPVAKPAKKAPESRKAPKKAGTELGVADPQARASIAGQRVQDSVTDSPELKELREVEDLLFWDIERVPAMTPAEARGPEVLASGLPPSVAPAAGAASAEQNPESGAAELRWMAQLSKPDLPFRWDVRLIRYLDYFKNNPRGRSFVQSLLKRSGKYDNKIREALRANSLPEDLVYLSLVESGMNPRVVSHAGAAGLWQFMPTAGEAYGLRIDKWVDERLDPHRSTEAAVRFLKDLHSRFGRWELAMAAYNMGHGGLLSSIRKYNTNDYWELSQLEAGIPYETALYVPKIVAIAFVARNKDVFGCADLILDPSEKFDTAGAPPADGAVAVGPKGAPAKEAPRPAALAKKSAPPPKVEVADPAIDLEKYTLRWGESLEHVAATLGTTESRLRALNNLKDPMPPRPGSTILVPKNAPRASLDAPVAVIPSRTTPEPGKKRVFYEVVWGDSLEDVARVLGVTSDALCHWNNLDRKANLHGKMVLQAYVPEDRALGGVRVTSAKDAKVLVVGSTEFYEHFEAKNGRTRSNIVVAEGDTMRSLAKKHGLSIGMMERINHRPRDGALKVGERLVVYRKGVGAAAVAPPAGALYADDDEERAD